MKKITILCSKLDYGGIEVAITNIANMLSFNYDIEIISSFNSYGKPMYKLNDNIKVKFLSDIGTNKDELIKNIKKIKIVSFIKELFKYIKISYFENKNMVREIKNCKSDIIISTNIKITELLNKHYIGNGILIFQEYTYHNHNQKYINRVIKSLKNIDYFMPISKKMTKFYKNKVKGKTRVMYGPLCLDYLPKKETKKDNKNIISIGRLSKEKGYLDLIDVFKIIHDKDKDCRLFIIGDGNQREEIENKIKEYKLNNCVMLYGYKDKDFIREKLNNMSLYILPSYEEAFGLTLLESSAYGIPSLAFSSAEGAQEIINNGIDGYLIENRDKEKMAKLAIELLNNKTKLSSLGHEARLKAENYSYDNIRNTWLGIISDILK